MARRFTYSEPAPPEAQAYGGLKWILTDTPGIVIWYGKSQKPKRYRFRNEAQRAAWLAQQKAADDAGRATKERWAKERAAAKEKALAEINVGDVLHYSWGYDQTNCEFFQVVGKSGSTLKLQEIESIVVPGSGGFMSDRRIPATDRFVEGSEPFTKRIGPGGVSMKFGGAYKVEDGETFYCSWYA
jgi:hypothetical protein